MFHEFTKSHRVPESAELVSASDGSGAVDGSEFHRVGPETAKLLCAYRVGARYYKVVMR